MKKVVSLLLALVLMVGLLSTAAFADEEEMYDIIEFDYSKIVQSMSERQAFLESLTDESMLPEDPFSFICTFTTKSKDGLFTLTATATDEYGWNCGGAGDSSAPFTITAEDGLTITRIEAEIGYYAKNYDGIGVSGNASKQPIFEKNGVKIAPITNINSSEFSISSGTYGIQLKNITVCFIGPHTHSYGEDNICAICGRTKCDVNGHNYQPVTVYYCQTCGEEAPADYVPEVPGGSTASTLSQGNVAIICSVAGVALGLVGGLLIGKKRKPAAANGANSGDKE